MMAAHRLDTCRFFLVTWSPGHLVTLSLLAAGCDLPGKPVRPGKTPLFEVVYGENCAGCHGIDGKLGPAPPLNDPLFRAGVPEEVVEMTIAEGRPGTPMPAFASGHGRGLTKAQIQILVCEIKGIPYEVVPEDAGGSSPTGDVATVSAATHRYKVVRNPEGRTPKWGVPEPLPEGAPSYQPPREGEPGVKAPSKERGKELFAQACACCHGADGKGGKDAGAVNNGAFLALISDQALRRYVITGRPDLRMPNYRDRGDRPPEFKPLTNQDVADLVALLVSWRDTAATGP